MNKLEMAHDFAMKLVGNPTTPLKDMSSIIGASWKYADAMQAEADKREDKTRPAVLQEEWQPDWSQAPDWANWWAIDGFSDKKANWYRDKPYLDDDSLIEDEWNIDLDSQRDSFVKASSFGYTGRWQDSLRKRPESGFKRYYGDGLECAR